MTGSKDAVAGAVFRHNGHALAHSCRGVPRKRGAIKFYATMMGGDRCNGFEHLGASSTNESSQSDNFSSAHSKRYGLLAVMGTN